ncbi:helix-turn-helix domain-containing protein [Amycolatopsis sp. NPDC051371]|uniref:PucR family transcriptional regulator n=1 Tax=Amycolatopsis sp. NPDC051371 TaxID=3155800 RepID=UPI00343B49B9
MLVSAAPAEAERVAREVFGALLELKPHESAVLTRTLRVWCANDGSPGRTAEVLHCHANTIRYRLRRIEDLTGRSLRSPQDLAEIVTALNACASSTRPTDRETEPWTVSPRTDGPAD